MKHIASISNSKAKNKIKFSWTSIFIISILIPILGFFLHLKFYNEQSQNLPRFWGVCVHKWNPNGSLRSMERVFKKLGYLFVTPSNVQDFDVLWSIENPFTESGRKSKEFKILIEANYKLKPHQRVNHFPGIYVLTNKGELCTTTKSNYLLPSFRFPNQKQEFEVYVKNNPDKKWIEKNVGNRGVKVVGVNEINFQDSNKIVQEFLHDPFLVDGHSFDFGIYVLISSIEPLRVYRYDHEVFIRFCPEIYHPFDSKKKGKYVVDETHLAAYEMESFKDSYFNYSYSSKSTFENLVKSQGHDIKNFWNRIDDAITSLIIMKQKTIIEGVNFNQF